MNTHDLLLEYNHSFASNWYTRYDWENDSSLSYKQCEEQLSTFTKDCFISFSESLLRGEYIVYLELGDQLHLFNEQLLDIKPNEELSSCRELLDFSCEFNKFNRALSFVIDSYRYFIIKLQNKYRLDNHHFLVNAFSIKGRDRDLSTLFRLFCDIELPITHLDHFFVPNDGWIRELIYSKNACVSGKSSGRFI